MTHTIDFLFSKPELFINLSGKTPVSFICCHCNNVTEKYAKELKNTYKAGRTRMFCSKDCFNSYNARHRKYENCMVCDTVFFRVPSQAKKTNNRFCSKSCAAIYNNKNKTHGTRRSKLETWLENSLVSIYPDIEFHFNKKDAIGSELDIYIPQYRLAFELNGIFHYEPIYGQDKLNKTLTNDQNKFYECHKNEISLCIIDTTSQRNFTEKSSKKFLDIITSIIETKRNEN